MYISSADFVRYNANTRNSYVGDCVKRALTVAYSMDYDEVSRELNQIKRELHKSAYNISPVYREFLRRHGSSMHLVSADPAFDSTPTVDEFCDFYNSGTYVLEVGPKPNRVTDHLCTCVDGKVYDSWDSRNNYVQFFYKITDSATSVYAVYYEDVQPQITEYLKTYLDKLSNKNRNIGATFSLGPTIKYDRYTYEQYVLVRFDEFPPKASAYARSKSWGHIVTVKLNPRKSLEDNVSILSKKLSQKIYDWFYNIRRDIEDAKAVEEFEFSKGAWLSSADKRLIMHLPEWCRNRITSVDVQENFNPETSYGAKYEVYMDALPEDPNIDSRGSTVRFEADTLTELKDYINLYKSTFARFYYEY